MVEELTHRTGGTRATRLIKQSINQGRSVAGLECDGLGALGHGVPVLGVDGYEYVR